jgi:hypothetical protein
MGEGIPQSKNIYYLLYGSPLPQSGSSSILLTTSAVISVVISVITSAAASAATVEYRAVLVSISNPKLA